mmetsp:Transcript_15057/g.22154  ORF Transcript_15057/g.22154 Transcript_15057/m.22154 type:complete len:103 (+) Transcript_15057:990-1298(+)
MHLFDTSLHVEDADKTAEGKCASPLTVMQQDLIAAGWQCAMAEMNERWKDNSDVKDIMKDQNAEFSFPSSKPSSSPLDDRKRKYTSLDAGENNIGPFPPQYN